MGLLLKLINLCSVKDHQLTGTMPYCHNSKSCITEMNLVMARDKPAHEVNGNLLIQ